MVKVLDSFVRGPLEAYAAGFAQQLPEQGYTHSSAEQHLCFIAHLDRWMTGEGIGLGGLNTSVLDRYLLERRAAGNAEYLSGKALRPLLEYLSPFGVLPAPVPVELGPVDLLLAEFRDYLLTERGLTEGTVRGYVDAVRPFVTSRLRAASSTWRGLPRRM